MVTAEMGRRRSLREVGVTRRTSAWWSDALNDPWRDPDAPTMVRSLTPALPPPEQPDVAPQPARAALLRLVILVAATTALLAGALGGALGYVAATRHGPATVVLGSGGRAGSGLVAERPPDSLAGVVARVMPSVVTVHGNARQGESMGSGFVIAAEGYILTNEHVVADIPDDGISVNFADSSALAARVIGRDTESDLAVLKVDRTGLPAVEFGDSDAVAVGDSVLAIGSP